MTHLLHQRCQALSGPPMGEHEIRDHLAQVSGWQLSQGAIEKTFSFKNFHETMAFVNALAWIAHTEDHHPDLAVSYSRCVVRFNTHSVGGVSVNDFICAAKADALVAFVG
ncbi:MAG: 4a-hydroxytetrahydrobiopterin dehydratase [Rhizobacter sp.]|nr:4a-hydroxytetrahydrobiopterin dehydratase [Rhizobacter sp.]